MASPSIRINLSCQELVLEKSGKILLQCPVSSGRQVQAMKKVPGKPHRSFPHLQKNRGRRTGGHYFHLTPSGWPLSHRNPEKYG